MVTAIYGNATYTLSPLTRTDLELSFTEEFLMIGQSGGVPTYFFVFFCIFLYSDPVETRKTQTKLFTGQPNSSFFRFLVQLIARLLNSRLRLGVLKRQYPNTPILGLTATATERVLTDIQSVLELPKCPVLRAGFNRTNLFYEVLQKAGNPAQVADQIASLIKGRFAGQSGLIYCLTRSDCEVVMSNLHKHNLKVAYYHAALE
eukprot:sb/3470566/